jgi:acyl carrier protein
MDSKEVYEKVKALIAEKLEIDSSKISMNASFRKDLGADSLDTYELVYAIEEELGISIPDEKANEFETVKDAVDFLTTQL